MKKFVPVFMLVLLVALAYAGLIVFFEDLPLKVQGAIIATLLLVLIVGLALMVTAAICG